MITWMQKNKKYLVVTIWISTIAFVGAGFVGWGAYDFNKNRATSIAKVGNRSVSVKDLNDKYSQLYGYYNTILGGKLTKEQAEKMGLQKLALDASIQDELLLNLADDLGFMASDDDVVKYIVADKNFHKDGIFNKQVYLDVLRRNKIVASDYENSLKKIILLDKLKSSILLKPNDLDIEMISSSIFMKDKIKYKVIDSANIAIDFSDDDLKSFWEPKKNLFLTKQKYQLDLFFVPLTRIDADKKSLMQVYNDNKINYVDKDGKILPYDKALMLVQSDYDKQENKSLALKKYIDLKKGIIKFDKNETVEKDDKLYQIASLNEHKSGDILKPLFYNNGYIIIKVKDKLTPKPMDFLQAKDFVIKEYKSKMSQEKLIKKAKQTLENLDKLNLEVVTIQRGDNALINGLNLDEVRNFEDKVFASNLKKSYVIVNNKAIVYEILEQKLLTKTNKQDKKLVDDNAISLKNGELVKDLITELKKRYKVEEYIKR